MNSEIKKTLRIAYPIILGNFSQMLLGVIDIIMVGAIDHKQLAAASLVTSLLTIPFVIGFGLTRSISPMVAISNGRKDTAAVSHYMANGVVLCLTFSVVAAFLIHFLHTLIFYIGQDPEVVTLALPYLRLIGWSIIPMLLFMSVKEFTDALEQTRVAMLLSLLALPVNIFLNWLLIYGKWGFPRLELAGAGWATLITRILLAVSLIFILFNQSTLRIYIRKRSEAWKIKISTIRELLKIGIPSSLQYSMEAGAFAISGVIIGWFGAAQQAAHQIALSCASLTFMIAIGISVAGSIRVSNAYGREDWSQLRQIGRSTLQAGLLIGAVFAFIFIAFHQYLPAVFNQEASVISIAATLLILAALFQVSDATQAIGVGLLRGIRDVKRPTLYVALAYWIVGLPLGYFLSVSLEMKATGIWIGFVAGLSISSLLLNLRFIKLSDG